MIKTRIGVAIGRFQPITASQFESVIVPAVTENDAALIILGSSLKPRTPLNPFDSEERATMIDKSIGDLDVNIHIEFAEVRDYLYDNTQWLCDVQGAVNKFIKTIGLNRKNVEVTLYGAALKSDKDFYRSFPRWSKSILPLDGGELADLVIRNEVFDEVRRLNNNDEHPFKLDSWREEVPAPAIQTIENWISGERAGLIVDEDSYIKNYIKNTQNGRYPIIFQTVDNVVIHKGNILLIERGARPGKGQLAMPGGFLKADLNFVEGAVKELREETRLRVSMDWLKADDRFGHPARSLRGRTITQCFLWEIPDWKDIPIVKGGSDAKRAKWYELQDILDNRIGEMFEDHLDIIEQMLKRRRER